MMSIEEPIHEVFKIPVYGVNLDLDIKKLQSFCSEYQHKDTGRIISNIGGYQSNDLSLDDVSLQPLIKEIEIHSSKFASTFINKNKQVVESMWFNINLYKDVNKAHAHPYCDIAGVYYVKTPDECGSITFQHPAINLLEYYNINQPEEWNAYNSSIWRKSVSENKLYLFPGWLLHSVDPNENKTEERISISFNTRWRYRTSMEVRYRHLGE